MVRSHHVEDCLADLIQDSVGRVVLSAVCPENFAGVIAVCHEGFYHGRKHLSGVAAGIDLMQQYLVSIQCLIQRLDVSDLQNLIIGSLELTVVRLEPSTAPRHLEPLGWLLCSEV